jgi:hypothetical protein
VLAPDVSADSCLAYYWYCDITARASSTVDSASSTAIKLDYKPKCKLTAIKLDHRDVGASSGEAHLLSSNVISVIS